MDEIPVMTQWLADSFQGAMCAMAASPVKGPLLGFALNLGVGAIGAGIGAYTMIHVLRADVEVLKEAVAKIEAKVDAQVVRTHERDIDLMKALADIEKRKADRVNHD
jgi:hypothetical protein